MEKPFIQQLRKIRLAVSLRLVTVKLPEKLIDDVDQLVKAGIYHSRSDAIRAAVRDLLRRELWQTPQP